MSYTQYNFKRDFFYEAENAIENSSITFITGPKKCGKTVCLRQLADAYENALYINMKHDFDTDEKRNDCYLTSRIRIFDTQNTKSE